MAKLKAFVTRLEDIADEALRDLYVPDKDRAGNDRFKLDAEGLEDVSALKSTVTGLRDDLRKAKERAEPLAELKPDENVDEIITAGRETLERRRTGKDASEIESVKEQMRKAAEKNENKLKATIEGQRETLQEVLIANEVRAVSADPEIKANATLLLPHIERMATIVESVDETTGKVSFAARVLGPDKKTVRVDGSGNPLTIKALVAELRENNDYSGAFLGSGASGSGSPPDGGSGMPTPPRTPSARTPADAKAAKRSREDYGAI